MQQGFRPAQRPVASGDYVVGGAKSEILEAFLGTCVGVTLCDRQANVGGLLHLLLPEPTGVDRLWQPAVYATTGLPVFLKALLDAGASRERLEACVAGGALVGPLCELDLSLNIGGRTAEIVEEFLSLEKIPVQKTETGGFFTCCLSLNMQTWESHIEPLGQAHLSAPRGEFKKPTCEEIDRSVEEVRPIPQIALKIIRMVRDHNRSFKDISKEIRQDQVLTAKILRLCRSPLFGMRCEVDSIDRALIMLGEKLFLELVVSASAEDFYPRNGSGYSLCKGGLYKHALGTAMISENLANFTGKVPPDIAYTAGLLHDIGKVVLDQYITRVYALFYRRTQVDGVNITAAERELFGITHTEVGGRMAARWSLPAVLTDVISYHHHPERATVSPELVHLVYLADLIMSRFMVGHELERLDTSGLGLSLERLGISPGRFPIIIDGIPRQIFNTPRPEMPY